MKAVWKIGGSLSAIALLVVLARILGVQELLQRVLAWVDGLGPLAPVVFALVYVAAAVLLLPGAVLTVGAGAIFGIVEGTIVVSVGATLGAAAAFLVGRYLAREWVAARIARSPRFGAIDEAVAREGWRIVALTRLSPIFPFNLLNYAYGVSGVSFGEYFLASWLGMLPGIVLYVYLGSFGGDVAAGRSHGAAEWTLRAVGLAATIAVTVLVTRSARKALNEKVS